MGSAPTLKFWMTPFASVAILEKLALLKIALCRPPPRAAPLPPAWLLNCCGLVLTYVQFVLVIAVQVDLGAPRFTPIRTRDWRHEIGGSYPDWHSQVHYSVCFLQGHELAVNGFQSGASGHRS